MSFLTIGQIGRQRRRISSYDWGETAAHLYVVVAICSWFASLLTLGQGVPLHALLILLPITLVSLVAVFLVLRGRWRQQVILGRLCAATLAVNIGTSAAYLLAFLGLSYCFMAVSYT